MPSLIIFDVGHGSCIFLQDDPVRTLFDCKDAALLIEYLLANGIDEITQAIISHADADHIYGMAALLQSDHVRVHSVYVNADACKDTDVWNELKIALQDAANRKGLRVMTTIGAQMPAALAFEAVRIEVVAPGIAWRLTGNGGTLPNGATLNANSMSVAMRLHHDNHPVALLAGDIDALALGDIVARNQPLNADVLLFPHHGGHVLAAGNLNAKVAANATFTTDLLNRCDPKFVIFSIGRGVHSTPRLEIIQRIHEMGKPCMIACTQLSEHCHSGVEPNGPVHLGPLPALGRLKDQCCGGTLEIQLAGATTVNGIVRDGHLNFINQRLSAPRCVAHAPCPPAP